MPTLAPSLTIVPPRAPPCALVHSYQTWERWVLQVAFMFNEWYKPHSKLEFPRGGSQAMVDALARGVSKKGGRLHARSHVDKILLENGRAAGVRLKNGAQVRLASVFPS